MKDELVKFGVYCFEFEDGIEVIGKFYKELVNFEFIYCYDDYCVVMSFSVFFVLVFYKVFILECECIVKIWLGWWDILF